MAGTGKSPITERSNRSAELQNRSPAGRARCEGKTKMKAINRIKEHTGRKTAGGLQRERELGAGKETKNMKRAVTDLHVGLDHCTPFLE